MPLKIPSVIGHRGAAAYAPENTIEGIKTAADLGAKWIELDVKLSKDSIPILFHDDDLDRTTNGHGPVADMNWNDLKDLDAGAWFSDSFAGIGIPSLEEALDVILDLDLSVNLEIKPCAGREIETAEAMLDLVSQVYDDLDRILISSFSYVSLETALDMLPDAPRGLLLEPEWPENWQELVQFFNPVTINVSDKTLSNGKVAALLPLQKPVLVYTVNDADRARLLRQWGVSGVFTDDLESVTENLFKPN
jgi:glycerophosphoryl diester phosphodiesterase